MNHGGVLVHDRGGKLKVYMGGITVCLPDNDLDRFGYFDIEDEVKKLGYVSWRELWFKLARIQTWKQLRNDDDVMKMLKHLGPKTSELYIYVDCGVLGDVGAAEVVVNGAAEVGVDGAAEVVVNGAGEVGVDGAAEVGFEGGEEDGIEIPIDEILDVEGGTDSDEDGSYIQSIEEESNDGLSDDDFEPEDIEYLQVRENLRIRVKHSITDELGYVGGECGFSGYERSDEEVYSSSTDDERLRDREKIKRIVYDPKCDHKQFQPVVGMRFVDGMQARDALVENAIQTGREIYFRRIGKKQTEAYCNSACKWRVYGSMMKRTDKEGRFELRV